MINKDRKFKEIKFKIERTIVKNLFWFIVFFFLIILYQSNIMNSLKESQVELKQQMEKNLNSYVAITEDGVPVTLPRSYIGVEYNKEIIKNALLFLVVSRAEISNNFQVATFKSNTDLIKNSDKLSTFATEYIILHKNLLSYLNLSKEELKQIEETNVKGVRYFTAYTKYLNTLFIEDKLPHKINIIETKIRDYKVDGNQFSISLDVVMLVDRYIGQTPDGKTIWDTKKGVTNIKATGYFDIRLRTRAVNGLKGINTRGLRFTSLSVKYAVVGK